MALAPKVSSGDVAVWRVAAHPLVFFCCAVLWIAAENASAVLAPGAPFEDGRNLLAFFHDASAFSNVFRYYASYVSLAPNLLGWAVSHAPLAIQPTLFVWASILLSAGCFSVILLPSLRVAGLGRSEKLLIAWALLVLPLGNMALFTLLMYALWHLLILACLLTVFWKPRSETAALLTWPVLILAVTSHPASICLLPFLAWRAIAARGYERAFWAASVLVVVVYVAVGVDWGNRASSGTVLPSLELLWRLLSERVVFEGVFGTFVRMHLIWRDLQIVMWVVAGLLLAFVLLGTVRHFRGLPRTDLYQPVATAGLVLGVFLFSAVVRETSPETVLQHRYFYPSQILLIVLIAWALKGVLRGPLKIGRAVLIAGAVWLLIATALHQRYHQVDPMLGQTLSEAIALYNRQSVSGPACVMLERGEWTILLRSAPDADPCVTIPGVN